MSDNPEYPIAPSQVPSPDEYSLQATWAQCEKLEAEASLLKVRRFESAAEVLRIGQDRLNTALQSNQTDAMYCVDTNARTEVRLAHHLVDGEIPADRRYEFIGAVDDPNVGRCYATLSEWHKLDLECAGPPTPFTVIMHSPGGAVITGFRLMDHLTEMKLAGHHLTMIVRGCAASMGATILQAGDVRIMGAESMMLIHELSGGANGKAGEMADTMKLMEILTGRVLGIYSRRTKMTPAEIKRKWARTDWWLSSDEALKYGFVDEIA